MSAMLPQSQLGALAKILGRLCSCPMQWFRWSQSSCLSARVSLLEDKSESSLAATLTRQTQNHIGKKVDIIQGPGTQESHTF